MSEQPVKIQSQPGIKRDGTKLESEHYTDGLWCRFQRGRPRKMGGYQQVTDTIPEVARGIDSFSSNGLQFIHIGHPNTLGQYQVNSGTLNAFNDRTPAAFGTSAANLWQFATFADTSGTGSHLLIAHAGTNLGTIDRSVTTPLFAGAVTATTMLVTAPFNVAWSDVSGGIVVTGQFLFSFSSDGLIEQSQINDLSLAPVAFNMGTQKIVKGFALRGAGGGPAVLLWSLDSLIRGTFLAGGPPDFAFDFLSTDISILSSQGVVEYDGVFFWPGVDRFLLFNGVVREMKNDINLNFFFDNLNFVERQKVFGFKVPRFGEIWWCFPRGAATECNHAVVYNVRENTWYDTALPDSDSVDQGRTAGIFAKTYQKPFMVDNEVTANGRTLWQHETAVDRVRLTEVNAIQSFFETHEISMLEQGESTKELRVARIEPDFVQTGNMTLTVRGRQNAKAPQTTETAKTFVASPTTGTDETIKTKNIKRLMSFRFESNVQGGNYEHGDSYAHIEDADGRIES